MTTETQDKLAARLNQRWNAADLRAFADLDHPEPLASLKQAEQWLAQRPMDSSLLLACARLAMRAELYGKARRYLESSLAAHPSPEAALLLAHLLEHTDQRERAYKVLKNVLTAMAGGEFALPKIHAPRSERRKTADRRRR